MRIETLKYFYEKSSEQNPAFYYRGPFLEKFTNTMLDISKGSKENQDSNLNKKVSFVLVESFQNILKHAENREKTENVLDDEGLFSFKSVDGAFVINSINVVQNPEVPRIEELVNQVNSMNQADLKQFYLESLKNNTISEKGGAGLGLIEMARKSGDKILYKIDRLNDRFAHFHQQITTKKGENNIDHSDQLFDSGELYKRMNHENLILLYKGDFSQKSILPLLELAEHNVKDKSVHEKRTIRATHVTVEVLQNISKHTRSSENMDSGFGVFILGKDKEELFILAGNTVSLSEKILLEEKLDYLISLDNDGLKELHRSTLKATLRFESKMNSGLGLIEVAQASSQSLLYKFYPLTDDQFLFALQVVI